MGSQRAFTLVEVLVVSAIIAILAAVAIPVYSNYVSTQRRAVVKGLAETAAVSANIFLRRNRESPTSTYLKNSMFFPDPTRFDVVVDSPFVRITDISVTDTVQATARFN